MAEKPAEVTTSTALAAGQGGVADVRPILIVAGVSGSGKTTIATALAQRLGLPFAEGGQLHPSPNIAKVHTAHPLDDRQWWSWLEKIAAWIDGCRQLGTGGVITSPVLRRSHRDFLTRGRPDVRIVYLHGERALIALRGWPRAKNIPRFLSSLTISSQFWRSRNLTKIQSSST
jgi:gluconokinase